MGVGGAVGVGVGVGGGAVGVATPKSLDRGVTTIGYTSVMNTSKSGGLGVPEVLKAAKSTGLLTVVLP